jgi:NADH:ubiquinone oxidoreductase subunit 4 (subunit M)
LKTQYISQYTDLTRREAVILASLFAAMLVLGLNADFVLDFVRMGVRGILLGATNNIIGSTLPEIV